MSYVTVVHFHFAGYYDDPIQVEVFTNVKFIDTDYGGPHEMVWLDPKTSVNAEREYDMFYDSKNTAEYKHTYAYFTHETKLPPQNVVDGLIFQLKNFTLFLMEQDMEALNNAMIHLRS